jgi:hypothetical protein
MLLITSIYSAEFTFTTYQRTTEDQQHKSNEINDQLLTAPMIKNQKEEK